MSLASLRLHSTFDFSPLSPSLAVRELVLNFSRQRSAVSSREFRAFHRSSTPPRDGLVAANSCPPFNPQSSILHPRLLRLHPHRTDGRDGDHFDLGCSCSPC